MNNDHNARNAKQSPHNVSAVRQSGSGRGKRPDLPCYGGWLKITVSCAAAILIALLTAALQSGFFLEIRPFGRAPQLCLALTVAVGMLFGERFGAVTGVASAVFIDAVSIGGLSLNILFYLVCGAAAGLLRLPEPRPLHDIARYSAILAASCSAKQGFLLLWVLMTSPSVRFGKLITDLFLSEILCTVLFSIPLYLLISFIFALYRKIRSRKSRI